MHVEPRGGRDDLGGRHEDVDARVCALQDVAEPLQGGVVEQQRPACDSPGVQQTAYDEAPLDDQQSKVAQECWIAHACVVGQSDIVAVFNSDDGHSLQAVFGHAIVA